MILLLFVSPLYGQQNSPSRTEVANTREKYRQGEVLVRFKSGVTASSKERAHAAVSGTMIREWKGVEGLQRIGLSQRIRVEDALKKYRANPDVSYAEPNYVLHAVGTPNDAQFSQLWSLQNTGQKGGVPGADIHATQAWNMTTGSPNVVVAVIDTGIDYTHPDLAANVWSNPSSFTVTVNGVSVTCPPGAHGYNAILNTCDPLDDNGHGSHVSGIVGAAGNNGIGVVGVNWAVQLMACKFLDLNGDGDVAGAISCLDFIKDMKASGANVVATNNSWGGLPFSQALEDAISAQEQAGILFVAAAGNDFSNDDEASFYPASYGVPNIITVAATTRFDSLADFSDIGQHSILLGAPGQEILSTTPNNTYTVFSGTSMASPYVAGVAALLAAQDSTRDWRTLKNLILAGGDSIPALSQTLTGKRLDAYGAMNCSNSHIFGRLQPTQSVIAGSVGTPISLNVLNINCAQPNGVVQVTVQPTAQLVDLVDDGTGSDVAAGDGVYSGQWTPTAPGSYTLVFTNGDTVDVEILTNYTAASVPYRYVSISGTSLNLGDDATAQISSPFPIAFGGGQFTNLYISSNGTVSFTDNFDGFVSEPLPQPAKSSGNPFFTLVAPWWQDLYPVSGSGQNIFWDVVGTAPNRELVIEWRDVRSFACLLDDAANITFEVVFPEASSTMFFNYANAQFGGACASSDYAAQATVGVQIAPGNGLQSNAAAFQTSQDVGSLSTIEWDLATGATPPSSPVPTITSILPSSVVWGSAGFSISVNGAGFTSLSKVQLGQADRLTTYVSSTQLTALIPATDLTPYYILGYPESIDVENPAPGGGISNLAQFVVNFPVPTINLISPSSAAAGSFGFQAIISGTGFLPNSTVTWNGQSVLMIPGNSNQLSIAITSALLAIPGTAQIKITNPTPGGGTSNAATFTIQVPIIQAQAGTLTTQSGLPAAPQVRPTLPVKFLGWKYAISRGGPYLQRFMRQRSDAALPAASRGVPAAPSLISGSPAMQAKPTPPVPGFVTRKPLPADFLPTGVATGDFNRDGHMDWVVSSGGGNDLWLYIGNGDGTAETPTIIPLQGQTPVDVVAADLRKIGVLDLIVAEPDSGTVEVLLGNGDGTFRPGATYYTPSPPAALAAGDFNHDGNVDILVGMLDSQSLSPFATFPGDGTGRFGIPITLPKNPATFSTQVSVLSMAVADFNADGLPDVAAVTFNGGTSSAVYVNRGDGTFKQNTSLLTPDPLLGPELLAIAAGDVNADGCPDVVVTDTNGDAAVLPGNCNGSFQTTFSARVFGLGDVAQAVTLTDINGDGKLDLISSGINIGPTSFYGQEAGNLISVLLGDGTGNFGSANVFAGEPSMVALGVVDLNGSGLPDIVTANQDTDSTSVYLNDGHGGFGGPQGGYVGYLVSGNTGGTTNPGGVNTFLPVDVNGDGKLDLAALEAGVFYPYPTELTVILNDGTGKFGPPIRTPVLDTLLPIGDFKMVDFRNTGHPDFLAVASVDSSQSPFLIFAPGHGDGTFGPLVTTNPAVAKGILGTGDFNGDGKFDFVVAGVGSNSLSLTIFLGNGDGTFNQGQTQTFRATAAINYAIPTLLYVGDFNHDGKLDVLVWDYDGQDGTQNHNVYEFLGNGDGTFNAAKLILPNFGFFAVADLNHDGTPDIVEVTSLPEMAAGDVPSFAIYLGQADGSFTLTSTLQPYSGISSPVNFGGPIFQTKYSPLVADFNGDGNPDIAAFQVMIGNDNTPRSNVAYMQIITGNGDGTFTPSYNTLRYDNAIPQTAADVTGDGRADLIEFDQFASSYHVFSAQTGPTFQIHMKSEPVIGQAGGILLTMSIPASSDTTVQLSASDSAIQIPASVVIPAGTVTQEIDFTIGNGFDSEHVFDIQAQFGTETESAYGSQSDGLRPIGFHFLLDPSDNASPGGTSGDYGPAFVSLGGYSSTILMRCQGLPVGAACSFGQNPVQLGAGLIAPANLFVTVPSDIAQGSYSFTVTATDGSLTQQANATLLIGDFTISVSPASQSALPGATAAYSVTVTSIGGFHQAVNLAAKHLPLGATYGFVPASITPTQYFTVPLTINVPATLPQGTYTFNVSGTSAALMHTQSVQLVIGGVSGSISPLTATIATRSYGTFTVTVNSQNGYAGQLSLACPSLPVGLSCTFNPSVTDLPPNGTVTSSLNIEVASKTAERFKHKRRSDFTQIFD